MTVTVSGKNYTQISACDSVTNWTFNKVETDGISKKEGNFSLCGILNSSGDNDAYYTPGGYIDLSGTKHLRVWFLTIVGGLLNTDANGGIQLSVSDGTNTGYYKVSGRTTYPGGWVNLVVDVSRTVDSGTKPSNMAQCTSVGVRMNLTGSAKNSINTWLDNLCVCDGLIAYGDVSGSPFGLQEIYNADVDTANGWGILRKISGVYYAVGSITLGDDGGSNICDFQETNEVLIFEERIVGSSINVSSSLYEIICVAGTGTTDIFFGDVSGGKGISGCTIKSIDADRPFKITATDTDIDNFGLYASTFDIYGTIDLAPYNVNYEVLGCTFVNSVDQIQPNTMIFKNNFIISNTNTDGALLFESTSHNIEYNNFINNSRATEFTTANTYAVTGDQFSGNTYDIHFSALSGDLTINAGGEPTANPSSVENDSSGTVTIVNTVSLQLTVKDEGGTVIENARCYIEAASGGDLPASESVTSITRSGSTATVTHSTHGLKSTNYVTIEGANQPEYNGVHQITVTDVNTYTYTVTGTPVTPATGAITCTFVMMQELSNASGIAQEDFDLGLITATQPFRGVVRKASGSPYYRDNNFTGSFYSGGFSATITMVSDE